MPPKLALTDWSTLRHEEPLAVDFGPDRLLDTLLRRIGCDVAVLIADLYFLDTAAALVFAECIVESVPEAALFLPIDDGQYLLFSLLILPILHRLQSIVEVTTAVVFSMATKVLATFNAEFEACLHLGHRESERVVDVATTRGSPEVTSVAHFAEMEAQDRAIDLSVPYPNRGFGGEGDPS